MELFFSLRIHHSRPTCQCLYRDLLAIPTLLPVACLTGQNHGQSQFQWHESSFELRTFLGQWRHTLLLFPWFHTTSINALCKQDILMCSALDPYSEMCYALDHDSKMCHALYLAMNVLGIRSKNLLCIKFIFRSKNVLCDEINRIKLVSAHNYFI
jgi:hypothetical protein